MAKPKHPLPFVHRIRTMDVTRPPELWQMQVDASINGLTDIGFDDHSSMMLVVSADGAMVFDCTNGEIVACDNSSTPNFHNKFKLEAQGFGPLGGQTIRLAGLHGGAFTKQTFDGWSVANFVIDWPCHSLLLSGPASWVYDLHADLWKIGLVEEYKFVAWGFSPTGDLLVLATADGVTIWGRKTPR